jgi:hypothetical protein
MCPRRSSVAPVQDPGSENERRDETVMPLGIVGRSVAVWKYANLGALK